MDFEAFLRPEMITALSVSLGALLGGVVAVISEIRKPHVGAREAEEAAEREAEDHRRILDAVREECDHVNRSVWIVEKKLSDRLHAIEVAVEALSARL
jgi:hypothetical protein